MYFLLLISSLLVANGMAFSPKRGLSYNDDIPLQVQPGWSPFSIALTDAPFLIAGLRRQPYPDHLEVQLGIHHDQHQTSHGRVRPHAMEQLHRRR